MIVSHTNDGRQSLQARAKQACDRILSEVHRYDASDQTAALQQLLGDWLSSCRDPLMQELVLAEVARRLRLHPTALKRLVKTAQDVDSTAEFDFTAYRGGVSVKSNSVPEGAKLTSGGVLYLRGADLLQQGTASVEWLWHGLLARGEITLLSGREKAGKSTLAFGLLAAILRGEPFLNRQVTTCNVLLLEEAPKSVMDAAIRRFGLENVITVLKAYIPPTKRNLPELCPELAEIVRAEAVGLLVIDTFTAFSGLRGEQENQAGAVQAVLEPLRQLSDASGVGILLVHHNNRSEDEYRGSTALGAFVDTIVTLKRAEGNRPRHRVLEVIGRHTEETSLLIRLDEDGVTYTGEDPEESALQGAVEAILRLLEASAEPLTQRQLAEATGLPQQRVSEALLRLHGAGEVVREGKGTRGDPHRYALVQRAGRFDFTETSSPISGRNESSPDGEFDFTETSTPISGKNEFAEPDPFAEADSPALWVCDPVTGEWYSPRAKGGDSLDF